MPYPFGNVVNNVEWFTGLSSKFLSCPTSKLLVLAGMDDDKG